MKEPQQHRPKILIIFFSYSNQTRKLIYAISETLEKEGVETHVESLKPQKYLPFPLNSITKTFALMFKTLLRMRIPIKPLSQNARAKDFDLIILAGPTWSYNPSGPILSFLDVYGKTVLNGMRVLPLISCRSYWRTHFYYLRKRIKACGADCLSPWVFNHKDREPWKTLGVFFTVAGKNPRHLPVLKKHYRRYGHTREQIRQVRQNAKDLAQWVKKAHETQILDHAG